MKKISSFLCAVLMASLVFVTSASAKPNVITDPCADDSMVSDKSANLWVDTLNPNVMGGDTARIMTTVKDGDNFIAYKLSGHTHAKVTVYEPAEFQTQDMKFYVKDGGADWKAIENPEKKYTEGSADPLLPMWHKTVYDVYFNSSATELKIQFNIGEERESWGQQIGEVVIDDQQKPGTAAPTEEKKEDTNTGSETKGAATTDEKAASTNPKTGDVSMVLYGMGIAGSAGVLMARKTRKHSR